MRPIRALCRQVVLAWGHRQQQMQMPIIMPCAVTRFSCSRQAAPAARAEQEQAAPRPLTIPGLHGRRHGGAAWAEGQATTLVSSQEPRWAGPGEP